MYCIHCGHPISLLGLRDRETGYIQYNCSNCNTILLKNNNGLVFDKKELRRLSDDTKQL